MGAIVLVTGGAGFIGSHVVDALVAAGRRVRVLDILHPAAHARRPRYLNPEAEMIEADVRDRATVDAALAGVDAVSHQASMVGALSGFTDAPGYVAHNDLGTAVLLAALAARGFDGALVLASSMVVYGEGRYVCPEHGEVRPPPRAPADLRAGHFEPPCPRCGCPLEPRPIDERAPLDPRNVYAATKVAQEHLCACFAREAPDVRYVALRYHNVYGPRMPRNTPYAGVASLFRSRLEAGLAPRVFEDGRQRRDFVHVRDVARANVLALDSGAAGPFNIGSGSATTVGEMASVLSGGSVRPEITGEFRLGDVRHVFADISRARAELGYGPAVPLDEGMREFATAELRDPVGDTIP